MLTSNKLKQYRPALVSHRHAGLTLIELLVTIAIGTLLMLVAVPSFVQFQRNAQLSNAVGNFIAAANAARSSAMRQGLNTYLVPTTGTNWGSGWMVFTDANFDKVYNAGTEEVVLIHERIDSNITIKTSSGSNLADGYLLFNGSGYPRLKNGGFGSGTIEISNTVRSSSIMINPAGRLRSCKTGGSTDCPKLP